MYVVKIVMEIPDVKVINLGIKGFIRDYGTYEQLCAQAGLNVDGIRAAEKTLNNNKEARLV